MLCKSFIKKKNKKKQTDATKMKEAKIFVKQKVLSGHNKVFPAEEI